MCHGQAAKWCLPSGRVSLDTLANPALKACQTVGSPSSGQWVAIAAHYHNLRVNPCKRCSTPIVLPAKQNSQPQRHNRIRPDQARVVVGLFLRFVRREGARSAPLRPASGGKLLSMVAARGNGHQPNRERARSQASAPRPTQGPAVGFIVSWRRVLLPPSTTRLWFPNAAGLSFPLLCSSLRS